MTHDPATVEAMAARVYERWRRTEQGHPRWENLDPSESQHMELKRQSYAVARENLDCIALTDAQKRYLDEGWSGRGWLPSTLMIAGYCAFKSGKRPGEAKAFLDDFMGEARRRYREGYFADPFTDTPVRRPVSTAALTGQGD